MKLYYFILTASDGREALEVVRKVIILPAQLTSGPRPAEAREWPYHEAVKEFKCQLIANALQRAQGNQTKAAELLGLQRTYTAHGHKLRFLVSASDVISPPLRAQRPQRFSRRTPRSLR